MRKTEHDGIHAGEATTRSMPMINLTDTERSVRLPGNESILKGGRGSVWTN
jgi:hypothetical protein